MLDRTSLVALSLIVVLALVATLIAAPILPRPQRLPDEVRVLAKIDKVQLRISEPAPHLREAGFTVAKIQEDWTRRLTAAGFEVVAASDEALDDVAILVVETNSAGDDDVPDGVGFTCVLKVYQRVSLARLDGTFLVPTFVMVGGGMDNQADFAATVQSQYDMLVQTFITLSKRATDET